LRWLAKIGAALSVGLRDDAQKGDVAKADRDKLQGTCALVERIDEGVAMAPLVVEVSRTIFQGDRVGSRRDTEKGRFHDSRGVF
jgi:hypothetical protein